MVPEEDNHYRKFPMKRPKNIPGWFFKRMIFVNFPERGVLVEFSISPITGMMLGIEYCNAEEEGRFFIIDLLICRLLFVLPSSEIGEG